MSVKFIFEAAGFGVGPLTDQNINKPRLTPALIYYYDLLFRHLAALPDPDSSLTFPVERQAFQNAEANRRQAFAKVVRQHCQSNRRYGLGELYHLGVKEEVLTPFLHSLDLNVRPVTYQAVEPPETGYFANMKEWSLVTSSVVERVPPSILEDPENYPNHYKVGWDAVSGLGNAVNFQFAAGACLAEGLIADNTTEIRYAVCLAGVMLWWNADFRTSPTLDPTGTYAVKFQPSLRDRAQTLFSDTPWYTGLELGLLNKHSDVFLPIYSTSFVQGLISMYYSNNHQSKTQVIDEIAVKDLDGRWKLAEKLW